MRHTRNRRRFKAVLIALLTACVILLLESRIEAIVPEIRGLAEMRVEQMTGGRIKLSIGSVDGGIIHPVVLSDITIKQANGSVVLQSIEIDNIRTNYRIWDILNKKSSSREPIEKGSSIYTNFSMYGGKVTGFLALEGEPADTKLSASAVFFGKDKVNFTGTVKGETFDIDVRPQSPEAGTIRIRGGISDEGVLRTDIKMYHVKIAGFDIVCDAAMNNRVINSPDGRGMALEGSFETRSLIINYKPVAGAKAEYGFSNGVLDIKYFKVGDLFSLSGRINTREPKDADLTLVANNVSLSWLGFMLGSKEASSVITGTMNGKFDIKGKRDKINISSRFDVRSGTIGPLDFEHMSASLKGDMPFLKIEDSRITRKSGYFELAGEMDMRRIGKDNIFDDIRLVTDDGAITWDDWSSVRTHDGRNVSMRKRLSEDFDIEFRRAFDDYLIDESSRNSDKVGFEYKLQSKDSLKMMVGNDNDFFGFEHKDTF